MSDKKHIDRIFQERLKDFEVSPDPKIWNTIHKELTAEDHKPKTVFPVWLRIASLAALLAVLVSIGYFTFLNKPNTTPLNNTVDTNTKKPNVVNEKTINKNSNSNSEKLLNNKPILNPETSTANLDDSEKTDVVTQNKSATNANTPKSSILKTGDNSSEIALENTLGNNKSNYGTGNKLPNSKEKVASTSGLVPPNTSKRSFKLNETTSDSKTTSKDPNATNNNNVTSSNLEITKTAQTESKNSPELDTNAANRTLGNENNEKAIALNAMKGDNPHNEKEKEESLKVGDSLTSESPSIEDAIAQAEELNENEEKEKLTNRWQVYANVAPVYYNSLGKGSHIDEQFVSNSKSGEINMSYGVNISYTLSKKLAIRSGINSLNLSYDTDNVILYENPSSNGNPVNPMRNIDLTPENQGLNAFSGENLGFQQINGLSDAAISQRLSYVEVPVELEYKLINNRFGLGLIGGVSTFFLNNNEVYSEFEEYSTYIGEANNVNAVSFSTNLGLGMNYYFSDKFRFNLEPTFKYQLNAFSNTSGNFRPYIIGVYTGFSYKF